jgi:D-aspartate ligase
VSYSPSQLPGPLPAVVVGMNAGGLGVVRSLARRGVPTIIVDDTLDKPEMATRHGVARLALPIRTPALIDGLLELARGSDHRPVLIATQRLPLLRISEGRAALAEAYRMLLPAHEMLVQMENKEHLIAIASAAGLRLPRGLILNSEEALEQARDLRCPLILKPADNDLGYMQRFKKAYILDDMDAVARLARDVWPYYRNLVVQEWVGGGDEQIYFCLQYRDAEGRVVSAFVGRKLLSWPPGKGATAACTVADGYHEEVRAMADRLFDRVGLCGFGSIELKRDPATGDFYLIEPTVGRTDQQEEVATLNGVNIPYAAYCDLTGAPLPTQQKTPRRPKTWRDPLPTRWAQQQLRAEGRAAPSLRSTPPGVIDAYFRWDDPLPGLLNQAQRLPEPLAGAMRRLLGPRPAAAALLGP